MIIALPMFTGCREVLQSEGSVALLNDAGAPYSFVGATATLFPLNAAAVTPGQSRTEIGVGTVEADNGAVTLKARKSAVRDARLYTVEFQCPADADDDCEVNSSVHVVLNGAQLKAGGWQATALTEAAFHEVSYAVAAGYAVADIQTVLDHTAAALFGPLEQGSQSVYTDLLAWNPTDTAAVLRPHFLALFSSQLAAGADSNAVKLLGQQWITPLVSRHSLNDAATAVALAGQYAYVLDADPVAQDGAFWVVDISDPTQMESVGSLDEMGVASALQVVGNYAYVAESHSYRSTTTGALHIVDVSNPQLPVRLGRIDTLGRVTDVMLIGDYAVVTLGGYWTSAFGGLQIIDISNPHAPVALASLSVPGGLAGMAIVQNMLYAGGPGGLHQIDISNPLQPTLVRNQMLNGAGTVTIAGNYAYINGYTWGPDTEYPDDDTTVIRAVDISNPSWPVVGSVRSADSSSALTVLGDRLYASGNGFLEVIDISNPVLLRRIGRLAVNANDHWILPNGLAYIAGDASGLEVYDTRIVDRPPLLVGDLLVEGGIGDNAAVGNGYALAQVAKRGLESFDLRNPRAPLFLDRRRGWEEYFESIAIAGPYAYGIDTEDDALETFDISHPESITDLGGSIGFSFFFSYELHDVVVADDHAYVSYGYTDYEQGDIDYGGLFVVDIQNPSAPQLLATYQTSPKADALAVSGNYAYLALETGVEVIDISNPQTPVAIADVATPGPVHSMIVSDGTLYVAAGEAGIHLVDITEPASPTPLATLDTPGLASMMTVLNGYVYVADDSSGVQVVSVANRTAPVLVGTADTMGVAHSLFQDDGWLYAGTSHGFEVLKPLPAPTPE